MVTDGTGRTYVWDSRDRMSGVTGINPSTFVYDTFNRRTSRTIDGTNNGFIYDGFQPIHTLNGSTITGTLLSGLRLDERYARVTSAGTTALLSDAIDSLISMVNSSGTAVGTFTYEPYGKPTHSGTDSTGYRFTGQIEDATGLMYYRARYYNPRLSRFVSEDPIEFAGGANLYGYVDGDPILRSDPLGNQGIGPFDSVPPEIANYDPRNGYPEGYRKPLFPETADWCTRVPDFFPMACRYHDECYDRKGSCKKSCDKEFLKDANRQWPNFPGLSYLYYAGIYILGDKYFREAQEKASGSCNECR
ncbi:MAG: RHS repeat-associated core domain-containing protein [Burkholderiales bacterium]|nr:RHS repeat-associated core domain-containing protein [Burkholderiales bacterium]